MKRKVIKKTIKQVLILISAFFVVTFLSTMIVGERGSDQPYGMGAAPHVYKSMSFKETFQAIPEILFATIIAGIIGFFIQYEYNLNKLKQEEKLRKMIEEKEGKEQEEKKEEEEGDV
jgi:hypothetical protein